MIALLVAVCLLGQASELPEEPFSPGIRLGPCMMASFPSMSDEKDFVDLNAEAGLELELGTVAWGGSFELLGDVSRRVRLRGAVGITRFHGAYSEDYDPWSTALLGILTGGIGFLFGTEEDVVDLDDEALTVELQAYYILSRGDSFSFSAGAGPLLAFADRTLDSPNTSTRGKGTGFGFTATLRLDQESPVKLGCLPLLFGLEAGYRYCSVELEGEEADGFTLDFSGPVVRLGSYLGL